MQLDSLVMDREDAKERLAEYEKVLTRERSAEDDALAAGYRAAARGLPVISLRSVMDAGGWFDDALPRLAICRADATKCWVRVNSLNDDRPNVEYRDGPWNASRGALVGKHAVNVSIARPNHWSNRRWNASTVVPLVPPRHRPKRGRIGNFHVLWEVESWTAEPPVDPALLRHIRGDLWAVVATWDLTPLERAVLAQRQ